MLNHQRVTDGCHHGENLLAGWIPPHQVEQGIGLVLTVQLVDTLLCDQLHRDSAVILEDKDIHFRNTKKLKLKIIYWSVVNLTFEVSCEMYLTCMGGDWIPVSLSSSSESLPTSVRLLLSDTGSRGRRVCRPRRYNRSPSSDNEPAVTHSRDCDMYTYSKHTAAYIAQAVTLT